MKSKLVNYDKLYNIALSAIAFCFLYLEMNFLLPLCGAISFVGSCLGVCLLICHLFTRQRLFIILSLIFTICTIGYSLFTLYPFHIT